MVAWFLVLMAQSMAFTWVSRARNSGDVAYAGIASLVSNGIFFVSQILLISYAATTDKSALELVKLGIVYTAGSTSGSVLMHWISLRWLEKGKRKVGS